MAESIEIAFRGMTLDAGIQKITSGSLEYLIKDPPTNAVNHFRLMGSLIGSVLVLSHDDDGNFSVSVKEK